jgi:hypothetical protein
MGEIDRIMTVAFKPLTALKLRLQGDRLFAMAEITAPMAVFPKAFMPTAWKELSVTTGTVAHREVLLDGKVGG